MHPTHGPYNVGRTVLTIIGIVLLIIFGMRAASQASSLAAAGGQSKHNVIAGMPGPIPLVQSAATLSGVALAHTGSLLTSPLVASPTILSAMAPQPKSAKAVSSLKSKISRPFEKEAHAVQKTTKHIDKQIARSVNHSVQTAGHMAIAAPPGAKPSSHSTSGKSAVK